MLDQMKLPEWVAPERQERNALQVYWENHSQGIVISSHFPSFPSQQRNTLLRIQYYFHWLPWWLSGKESACHAGDTGSIPESGRSPEEGMATHSSILAWEIQ